MDATRTAIVALLLATTVLAATAPAAAAEHCFPIAEAETLGVTAGFRTCQGLVVDGEPDPSDRDVTIRYGYNEVTLP